MALGAAGVGYHGYALAVAAVSILADEHFAFLAVHLEQVFAALRARLAGHVVVLILRRAALDRLHERGGVAPHFFDEFPVVRLALGYQRELLLPLRRQLGGFEVGRHYADELPALGGGEYLPASALYIE